MRHAELSLNLTRNADLALSLSCKASPDLTRTGILRITVRDLYVESGAGHGITSSVHLGSVSKPEASSPMISLGLRCRVLIAMGCIGCSGLSTPDVIARPSIGLCPVGACRRPLHGYLPRSCAAAHAMWEAASGELSSCR